LVRVLLLPLLAGHLRPFLAVVLAVALLLLRMVATLLAANQLLTHAQGLQAHRKELSQALR
jgi:hypothetical protein